MMGLYICVRIEIKDQYDVWKWYWNYPIFLVSVSSWNSLILYHILHIIFKQALKDQIRRAAVSSMSNISEGFARTSDKEFANFLSIARGSVAEVQSQLYIALDLGYIDKSAFNTAYALADETSRLLTNFMKYLQKWL